MKTLILALLLATPALTEPTDALPDFSAPWSLRECIDWALDHNITVAQQEIALESRELEKNSANLAWLPSVSASASENWSFGRGLGGNNTYESGNSSSTGFSLGANMTLFDGLATPRRAQLASLNLEAATADLEKARDDIRVQVAQAFVQVLYNMEIADVAKEQLAIDSLQVVRLQGLLDTGKASASELMQQKASLSESRLSLVQAQNNVRSALLDLAQLLEFPSWEGFEVLRPAAGMVLQPISTPDDIYADALGIRPAIRAEQLRLEGTERSVQIARAAYLPSLSLSGGLGTNYYTSFSTTAFWQQLSNNFSQYVGLSLSIPIFDRFSTRNNVRSARLNVQNQQLQLRRAQQSLYKEIQQAWNGVVAAQAKYEASLAASDATDESYRLMKAKYENGQATLTEFNESRTQVVKVRSNLLQAFYEYLFQTRLVQFYRGGELDW